MIKTEETLKIGDYKEIINQIGGNKFIMMTGSKIQYYGYDDKGYVYLMIKLAKNDSKAQYLKIQYNSNDLYDMEFSRIKKTINPQYKALGINIYDEKPITIKEYMDVYAENLQDIFTEVTGMLTRLF